MFPTPPRQALPVFIVMAVVFLPLSGSAEERGSFDSLVRGLSPELIETLKNTGEVFRFDRRGIGIALAPDHPSLSVLGRRHDELTPDVMVEGLYLIPYTDGFDGINLDFYNITRRISKIAGVTYYSNRRKAVVPLFDDVYRIDDITTKRRLDDPVAESIPVFDSILMHMKEVNLGSGYYEVQYVYDGDSLGFYVKNLTTLRSLIKVVGKENMMITIILFPTELGYFAYGYCGVKLANRNLVFGMMDPFSGFYKRLYAMVIWVNNSLHGTDKSPRIGKELDF